jgi:hypothetical protein
MNTNPQLDFVKQQVEHEIGLYTKRKQFNRKAAFAFTVFPATLAALATVSIGISDKFAGSKWLLIVAMIASGTGSILGAWESLFSNRKLWRVNNVALTSLYEIKSDIEYREKAAAMPITQVETDQYFERLKSVRKEGELGYHQAFGNDQ